MTKKFLYKKSDGQPYEVIDKSPKGILFIRPMAVMKMTEELTKIIKKNFTHPYGHTYTDEKGVTWNITSDETKDCITVKEFVKDMLFRDSSEKDFLLTKEPVVKEGSY